MQIETIAPDRNILLDCGHPESPHSSITRGYGVDSSGKKHCYECCAKRDREQMQKDGKTCLYLTTEPDKYALSTPGRFGIGRHGNATLTNWPGSLAYKGRYKTGAHNMAGVRYDVWFTDETGAEWHGTQYGNNTQICYCRKLRK